MTASYSATPATLVNTTLTSTQTDAQIAALSDGGYVVVWSSSGQDGAGSGIYAQRFNASGQKVGGEVLVNTTTAGDQNDPSVTGLSNGGFVVAWTSAGQDGSGTGVYAQRFDGFGVKVGTETLVNTIVSGTQYLPSVGRLANGGFVVSWTDLNGADGANSGVFFKRFDGNGAPVGGDTVPYSSQDSNGANEFSGTVVQLNDGAFLVSWIDARAANDGVNFRKFDSAGAAVGDVVKFEAASNQVEPFGYSDPVGVQLNNGNIVFVYQQLATSLLGGLQQFAQSLEFVELNSSGQVVASGNIVAPTTVSDDFEADLIALSGGGFVAVWRGLNESSGFGLYFRRYDNAGNALGDAVAIAQTVGTSALGVSVIERSDGQLVVVWSDYNNGNRDIYQAVLSENSAPALTGTPVTLADGSEDTACLIRVADLLAGYTDADGNTLSVANLAATNGTLVNNNNGTYTFTPTANYAGLVTVTYNIQDGNGASVPVTKTFTLNDVIDVINGTATGDVLIGTMGEDIISGLDGNDNLQGAQGADRLSGGNGDDTVIGGTGADTQFGDAGNDTLFGETGNDLLMGGDGNDVLYGQSDADTLLGDAGADRLHGGDGGDVLFGGADDDFLMGESGADLLFGGAGLDTLIGGADDDLMAGEDGNDTLFGETGNDTLIGGFGNDALFGQDGVDVLFGEFGDDTAVGGLGDDRLYGQDGNDTLIGEVGGDVLDGGIGQDFLFGGAGIDMVTGGAGADVFYFEEKVQPADYIYDFNRAEGDKFYLFSGAFSAPAGFGLTAGVGFLSGAGVVPVAATATVFFDTNTKALWFDADGTGAGGAYVLAFLMNTPNLAASDFVFT